MRCKNCEYPLKGLTEHRCPECGRPFHPLDRKSFETASQIRWATCICIVLVSLTLGWLALLAAYTIWPIMD